MEALSTLQRLLFRIETVRYEYTRTLEGDLSAGSIKAWKRFPELKSLDALGEFDTAEWLNVKNMTKLSTK